MITEALIAKGLVAIAHFASAHMTAGAAAAIIHSLAGMSLAQIATVTLSAGFVAGCITWTGDRLRNLQKGAAAIGKGDYGMAIIEFGKLAISCDVTPDLLPVKVEAALEKLKLDSSSTRQVTKWVKDHESEIAKYIRDHK